VTWIKFQLKLPVHLRLPGHTVTLHLSHILLLGVFICAGITCSCAINKFSEAHYSTWNSIVIIATVLPKSPTLHIGISEPLNG